MVSKGTDRERERERAITFPNILHCVSLFEKCFLVFKELASYVATAMEQKTLKAYAAVFALAPVS